MKRILSTLIFALFYFGLIAQADTIFVLGAEFGAVTVVDDSTFQVSSEHPADQLGQGFLPTQIKVGYRLFDINGRLFRVSSIVSSNFGESVLQVVELQDNNIGPIGVGVIYRKPTDSDCVPIIPQGNTGLSPAIVAKIHNHNSVVGCGSGSGGGATVTSLPADSITVTPIAALPATTNVQEGLAEAGTNINALDILLADLTTLSGRPATSTDLGTFTGVTIPDASDTKESLQALETLGESKQKTVYFDNVAALLDATLDVGDVAITKGFSTVGDGGEATFYVRADSVSGYTTDSIAVIPVSAGFAIMDETKGLYVRAFGALDNVPWIARQSPVIHSSYTPSDALSSDIAIYKAIKYADIRKLTSSFSNNTVYFKGNFLVQDSSFTVPNGVNIWMEGASFVHSNHNNGLFLFDTHFSTTHRIKATHKMFGGGTFTGQDWYPKSGAVTEEDSTSYGVTLLNSRNVTIHDLEIINFNKGIDLEGETQGTVENRIYIHRIFGCRWGIYLDGNAGGWAHQNYFEGGAVKLLGTPNRTRTDSLNNAFDCGAVFSNANNVSFQNINFEGSTHYKYVAYVLGASNAFLNCRFEGAYALQLKLEAENTIILGSYGPKTLRDHVDLPIWYSLDGSTPVDAKGPPISGSGNIQWGGAMELSGSPLGTTVENGENATLSLATLQGASDAVSLLETRLSVPHRSRVSTEFTSSGLIRYYGATNLTTGGKKFSYEWEQRGKDVTGTPYAVDTWYSRGDFITQSGDKYFTPYPFYSTDFATDLADNKIVNDYGSVDPIIEFNNDGLYAESFIGKTLDGDSFVTPPIFPNGFALEATGNNAQTIATSTATITPAGKSGFILRNTSGGNSEITVDITNETTGHVFYIYNQGNSVDNFTIRNTFSLRTLDNQDLILEPAEVSVFMYISRAGSNIAYEISRTRGIENFIPQTGSSSPIGSITPRRIGDEYLQTTDDIWYKSYGLTNTDWVTIQEGLPQLFTEDETVDLDNFNLAFDLTNAPLDEVAISLTPPNATVYGFNVDDEGSLNLIMDRILGTTSRTIINHQPASDQTIFGNTADNSIMTADTLFIDANLMNDNAATHLSTINTTTGEVGTREASSIFPIIKQSAVLDFPSIATGTGSELTVTVTGAVVGDIVNVSCTTDAVPANSVLSARVSSANTVTVQLRRVRTTAYDPPSATYNILVTSF